jgi:uncharacterized BrkB/YihY/UPF0761 family membrane protein
MRRLTTAPNASLLGDVAQLGMPNNTSAPPPSPSTHPSQIPSQAPELEEDDEPSIRHPRGRIWPPLPPDAPFYKRFLRAVVRLVQGLHYHRAMRTAPAMAFHFFLSLLPAFVFIGFIVGAIARRRGVNAVMAPLIDNMPATTEVIIKNQLGRLAGADAHRLGPLAAAGFLWVASSGIHGLMDAVETVVGARGRPWWKQRLLSIAWVFGILTAVGLASFGIIQWDDVVHAGDTPATASPLTSATPTALSPPASATPPPPSSASWVADDPAKPERDAPPPESSAPKKKIAKVEAPPKGGIPPKPGKEPDLTELPQPKANAAAPNASATTEASKASNPADGPSITDATPKSKPPRRSRVKILRSEGERVLALLLSLAGAVGGLAGFYRFSVSHSARVKRRVLPGAFLAVFLWIVVTWAFGFYVKTLASYAVFYGSLAAVAVLLVWLWLVSLSILVGAELNSQFEGLRD